MFKPRSARRVRVHIPIGIAALVLFALATFSPRALFAAETIVPYYNGDGWATVIRYDNVTDVRIDLPFDNPGCGQFCVVPHVDAHSFTRVPYTEKIGYGYAKITANEALIVQSELITPSGAIMRNDPVYPAQLAYVFDLARSGPYVAGLLVGAETDSDVYVNGEFRGHLKAGTAMLVGITTPSAIVRNSSDLLVGFYGSGKGLLNVTGWVNAYRSGSIQSVRAYYF